MKATLIFLSFLVQSLCFAQLASWNNDSFKELDKKSSNNLKMWNEGNQFYYEEVSRNQNANGEVEVILNDINGRSMQVRLTDKSSYWKFPNDANWTVLYDGSWSVKPSFETPQKTMQARLTKGQKKKIEEDIKSLEESLGIADFNKLQQFRYDPKFKASLTPDEIKYYEDMIIENARIRREIDIESFNVNGENWKEERNNIVFINTYKKNPTKYETKVETKNSRQYLLYRLKPEINTENTTPVENNPAPVSNPIVNSTNASVSHKPAANIKSVQIGTQTWMVENLNVSTFRNGDSIPQAKNDKEWSMSVESMQPAWCYYDNNPKNGEKYGKLYNWYAVNDPRGLAPAGWHVPGDEEWAKLIDFLGGDSDAEEKLKSQKKISVEISYHDVGGYDETKWAPCSNCSYWTEKQKSNNPCTVCKNEKGKYVKTGKYIPKTKEKREVKIYDGWEDGTNESGFSALPGGYAFSHDIGGDARFSGSCYFWSTTVEETYDVWIRSLVYHYDYVLRDKTKKGSGLSVRCVRD